MQCGMAQLFINYTTEASVWCALCQGFQYFSSLLDDVNSHVPKLWYNLPIQVPTNEWPQYHMECKSNLVLLILHSLQYNVIHIVTSHSNWNAIELNFTNAWMTWRWFTEYWHYRLIHSVSKAFLYFLNLNPVCYIPSGFQWIYCNPYINSHHAITSHATSMP